MQLIYLLVNNAVADPAKVLVGGTTLSLTNKKKDKLNWGANFMFIHWITNNLIKLTYIIKENKKQSGVRHSVAIAVRKYNK